MDNYSIIVNVLIHKVLYKLIFINTGCKYFSIVNKNLIMELQLPRIKIPLKSIISFIKENTKKHWMEIMKIMKFSIHTQGY